MVTKALRMPETLLKKIETKATKDQRSFSAMVRILIEKGLDAK